MGYEIPGAIGAKLADPTREVFVFLGDGTYLMMPSEIVTSVQEGVKIIIVLVDNHGFASIGGLSRSLGQEGFGTSYRHRSAESGLLDGDVLKVDFAANARSLGAEAIPATLAELNMLEKAKSNARTTVIVVRRTSAKVPATSRGGCGGGRGVGVRSCARRGRRMKKEEEGAVSPVVGPGLAGRVCWVDDEESGHRDGGTVAEFHRRRLADEARRRVVCAESSDGARWRSSVVAARPRMRRRGRGGGVREWRRKPAGERINRCLLKMLMKRPIRSRGRLRRVRQDV
jgi:hypothetical protein